MRRKDREITDRQEMLDIMRRCDVCRLALHDGEYPYIVPLNFGILDDGEIKDEGPSVEDMVLMDWFLD